MKKKHCAGAAALLSLVLGLGSLMGCSKTVKTEDYATTVVATFGDEKIYLDEANFLAKSEQYLMESYYSMITGTVDFWGYDVGNGTTIEDTTREGIMARILQTRILDSKAEEYGISLSEDDEAKIEEAMAQYKENLQEGAFEKMGGTDELLSKVYHDNALANRVYEYMVADIDTDVDREEQRQVKVSYLKFDKTQTEDETSTDTESESATETAAETESETETEAETAYADTEEYQELEQLAEQAAADLKSGKSMDDVKADLEADDTLTVTQKTETFGKTDHENAFGTASFELETGEYATAYVEEDGWYVIYCEEHEDEAATDDAVQSVLKTRRSDMFNEKYEQLKADAPKFKVNEDVWASITMSPALYEIPETTAADETETEAASSEAESETETSAESEGESESAAESESETETESGSAAE